MALITLNYWFSGNHREREVVYDNATAEIDSAAQDSLIDPGQDSLDVGELIYYDPINNKSLLVQSAYPYAQIVDGGGGPPDPGGGGGCDIFLDEVTSSPDSGATDGIVFISASLTGTLEYQLVSVDTLYNSGWVLTDTFNSLAAKDYVASVRKQGDPSCTAFRPITVDSVAVVCDVVITGTSTTNDDGSSTGSITVTATSTGGRTYRLMKDNVWLTGWQSSNVFSGLAAGTYVVAAKMDDNAMCIAAQQVTIDLIEAYVCTLHFNTPACYAENASVSGTPDGAIHVEAVDDTGDIESAPANTGAIKFFIGRDFDYDSEGQTSADFAGLMPGTYEIYARVNNICRAVITLTVGYDTAYAVRHRFEWDQVNQVHTANNKYRFDIEDNQYVGSINNEDGGTDAPAILSWRGEDTQNVFKPIISSQFEITLNSPTDAYFQHLYTYDERRYRGRLYKWNGSSYDLDWQGYLTPMLYEEEYVSKRNYPVTFTFTDGLADLKDYDFSDLGGNFPGGRISIFDAVRFCLAKTNTELEIWTTMALTHEAVESLGYNTLAFVYFDPERYRNTDLTVQTCETVLNSLLNNMKCRLYQADGRYNIEQVSQKAAADVITAQYEFDGTFIGNETLNPRVMLRRANQPGTKITFANQTARRRRLETFGTIALTYNLGLEEDNNLLPYGRMEDDDIENGQLKGWNVGGQNLILGSYEWGLEKLAQPRTNSDYAFFARFQNFTPVQNQYIILTSQPEFVSWPGEPYRIKISFDVYTRPFFTEPYIFLDYCLSIGTYKLQPREIYADPDTGLPVFKFDGTYLVDENYVRLHIDEHLQWKTISIEALVDDPDIAGYMQLRLRIASNAIYDFSSLANLKATATTNQRIRTYDNRRRVLDTVGAEDFVRYYRLEAGTEAESSPEILEPDDSALSNFRWKLQKTWARPITNDPILTLNIQDWLQYMLVDNVRIEYLPEQANPIEEIVLEEAFNPGVKQALEEDLLHGDITTEMDLNYIYIAKGWLSESNNAPLDENWDLRDSTGVWPSGSTHKSLQKAIMNMMRGQYQELRDLLTGQVDTRDGDISYWNSIYEVRTGKIFLPMGLRLDLRNNIADVQLIETLSGGTIYDESSGPIADPDPDIDPPVSVRQHSEDFSNDFS